MKPQILLLLILIGIAGIKQALSQKPFEPYPEKERRLVQSVSFSADGSNMYLTHPIREIMLKVGDGSDFPELAIFEAEWGEGKWGTSKLIPISGKDLDYEPTISPDGNYLFFNSKRPYPDGRTVSKNNIWFCHKTISGWSDPELASICTFENDESYATLTRTNRLYFLAGIPNPALKEETNYEIYWSDFDGRDFSEPCPIESISSENGEGDPWVSPDESYLIFTRFVNGDWRMTCDLFISFRINGNWCAPLSLEELNRPNSAEFAVAVSPDEQWIYYRSNSKFFMREFQPILTNYKDAALQMVGGKK